MTQSCLQRQRVLQQHVASHSAAPHLAVPTVRLARRRRCSSSRLGVLAAAQLTGQQQQVVQSQQQQQQQQQQQLSQLQEPLRGRVLEREEPRTGCRSEGRSGPGEEPVAGVLLDIDGVLCCGDKALPGAAAAVAWLREASLPYRFVTNTTTTRRAGIAARLTAAGIPAAAEHIISPAVCAAEFLRAQQLQGPVALFVSPDLVPDFDGLPLLLPAAAADTDGNGGSAPAASAVVVGDLGDGWDYSSINAAFRLLMGDPSSAPPSGPRARPQLVSLGKTRYYAAAPDGRLSLDVGPFTAALEYAAGCEAVVTGKPAAQVFEAAAASLGLRPQQVLMVEDDAGGVRGAQAAGCRGLLVATGKYRPGDEAALEAGAAVLPSIAALPAWLEQQQQLAAAAEGGE